jgi:hypothetical protein
VCRNIKQLFNFDPPATDDEVYEAALQFVRKVSGANAPSKKNRKAFDRAVRKITAATRELIDTLDTTQPPKDRDEEAAKARARSALRFSPSPVIVFE